jgi:hypothetical protein
VIEVNDVQSNKKLSPMDTTVFGICNVISALQCVRNSIPIRVKLLYGKLIYCILIHLPKKLLPITLILYDMLIDINDIHPYKKKSFIYVIIFDNVTDCTYIQLYKKLFNIIVKYLPIIDICLICFIFILNFISKSCELKLLGITLLISKSITNSKLL